MADLPDIDDDRDALRKALYAQAPFRSIDDVDRVLDVRDFFPDGESYMACLSELLHKGRVGLMVAVPLLLNSYPEPSAGGTNHTTEGDPDALDIR